MVRRWLVVLALSLGGTPGATAHAAEVAANGTIVVSDQGFGPRGTWTYDGVTIDCSFRSDGPAGVAQTVTVECRPVQDSAVTYSCPLMTVTRTTPTVVGARASCEHSVDMGVGTSGATSANLGRLRTLLTCEAYVDTGVLVPPYTVTCADPGLPSLTAPAAAS